MTPNTPRYAAIRRTTRETSISLDLTLDGRGQSTIRTGLGFLDHMLVTLAMHARFDLTLHCEGDLVVDDHHSVEDCALALGQGVATALGDRRGIQRFASALAPLDEALARVVIDLSGRPHASVSLGLNRPAIGDVACENINHFFRSLANAGLLTLHVDVLRGENDHHKAEAAFKALALALREAVAVDPRVEDVPSTKGALS